MSDETSSANWPANVASSVAISSTRRGAFDACIVKRAVFDGYEIINEACADGIRIPRSIAQQHGLEGQ